MVCHPHPPRLDGFLPAPFRVPPPTLRVTHCHDMTLRYRLRRTIPHTTLRTPYATFGCISFRIQQARVAAALATLTVLRSFCAAPSAAYARTVAADAFVAFSAATFHRVSLRPGCHHRLAVRWRAARAPLAPRTISQQRCLPGAMTPYQPRHYTIPAGSHSVA